MPGIPAALFCAVLSLIATGSPVHSQVLTAEDLRERGLGITPADYLPFDEDRASLGRLLFYDPILSGNRNISCGTCHHHDLAGADAVSLGIGQGGTGIGVDRVPGGSGTTIKRRMSRNAPALFNLGAREVSLLFHDGRVSTEDLYGRGFNTPAEEFLPIGLDSLLAAQALFPLIGEVEMLGNLEDNEISPAVNQRIDYGWPFYVERVRAIREYMELFRVAFDDVNEMKDLKIVHVANALGEFVNSEWRSADSRFDRFIRGEEGILDAREKAGMELFFGKANCSSCHEGKFLTDQDFHALALPPLGPGRTRRFDLHVRDVGRLAKSDRTEDAYRFRTPGLRNVELTSPYGHNGSYRTLEGIVRHHLDPLESLDRWQKSEAVLPEMDGMARVDFIIHEDRIEMERYRGHVDIIPVDLDDEEIEQLVSFLLALTGGRSTQGRLGRPETVPSGLPVD